MAFAAWCERCADQQRWPKQVSSDAYGPLRYKPHAGTTTSTENSPAQCNTPLDFVAQAADVCFARAKEKEQHTLTYAQFLRALAYVAESKSASLETVAECVMEGDMSSDANLTSRAVRAKKENRASGWEPSSCRARRRLSPIGGRRSGQCRI